MDNDNSWNYLMICFFSSNPLTLSYSHCLYIQKYKIKVTHQSYLQKFIVYLQKKSMRIIKPNK